jgi:hypothetical protein
MAICAVDTTRPTDACGPWSSPSGGWSAVRTALQGFAEVEKELQGRWGQHDFAVFHAMLDDVANDGGFGQAERELGESTTRRRR